MPEHRPWLSENQNRIMQLLDILEAVADDRSINVGYPSDLLEEWKKEHADTVTWMERINRYAHWATEHYSSLWRERGPKYTMVMLDADTTIGSGWVVTNMEDLYSIAHRIEIETGAIDAIMEREKIRYGKHWDDERVKPNLDARDALFVDFARGVRKLDTERFRARNKK
jgi:hypothetical protein